MVKLITFSTFLAATVSATNLKWDSNYSYSKNLALTSFACSDGVNGLITKTGAKTVGELKAKLKPNVYIAATPFIASWNSPNCGKCYRARNPANNKSIYIVAGDVSKPDAVTGEEGFTAIAQTGLGQGSFNVYLSEVPASNCFA
ncbi:hypothetical protein TWF694_010156 [Orbilia ellipsospora]|uniref:Cerato-platanin n=1 Tax=Orbilia ellipsospora TaxID=2528407 RepID=A0AAV9X935_9PEZI